MSAKATARRVVVFIGTRPEAIKLAPVILQLQNSTHLAPVICSTGQHKEMLASALGEFDILPDFELDVMRPGQGLNELAGRLFTSMAALLEDVQPACILVQGDTTTALVGAMCGFYTRTLVGHVEAGLRSGRMDAPYPEEFNRRVVSLATALHFAPTRSAADNLLREGISPETVYVTGNTVVDALLAMREQILAEPPGLPESVETLLENGIPYVLITGHRRENFGPGMEAICKAVADLANLYPGHAFIYPVHLNPQVWDVVHRSLDVYPNVHLIPPCAYRPFLRLLDNCELILSDSGGIQEEAPSLGKQVLVMRETTERPEGIKAGVCHLVGTDVGAITTMVRRLLESTPCVTPPVNPYGDGLAGARIVNILERHLLGEVTKGAHNLMGQFAG